MAVPILLHRFSLLAVESVNLVPVSCFNDSAPELAVGSDQTILFAEKLGAEVEAAHLLIVWQLLIHPLQRRSDPFCFGLA